MKKIQLKKATIQDKPALVSYARELNQEEFTQLNRQAKILKAIAAGECFLIVTGQQEVGFLIFDYRFFDQGWLELIIIDEFCLIKKAELKPNERTLLK